MNRQEFDRATKTAIHKRATKGRTTRCENPACRAVIKGRNYHVDHIIADALRSDADKKRKLTAADGQLFCTPCHAEKTTKKDVPAIAKAVRNEAKHIGTAPQPAQKIKGQNTLRKNEKKSVYEDPFPTLPRRVCGVLIKE